MNKINPEVALRRIESFAKCFGKAHLYLAYHAAFPLALTPDLLYHLWANFQQDIRGEVLGIPWIAVADFLLSSLCDEVGYELYEIDLAVRNQLLKQLQSDERFGKQRINQLSDFLLEYVQNQLQSHDPDIQDFAKTQQWIALAYTQPSQAAHELALVFSKLDQNQSAELLRIESLAEAFAEPLSDFQPLLIYARGMGKFARGNLEAAQAEFVKVLKKGKQIQVAKVILPIPEQIKSNQTQLTGLRISRKQFFKWVGFGGIGLVTAIVTREFSKNYLTEPKYIPPTEGGSKTFDSFSLWTVEFKTVMVNKRGDIVTYSTKQAKFFKEDLGNGVTLEMVKIPGGTFTMGSPAEEVGRRNSQEPQHKVTVSEFFMGKYEVTQAQYEAVMDRNPSNFKGENRPVEKVSWNDAVEFCKILSQKTERTYRLPSEAEWEYACRAGTTTPFHFGETITTNLVNYYGNSPYPNAAKGEFRQETTPVGNFLPNYFGLYDMHGNVWEWCMDSWHKNYEGAPLDGSAWITNNNNSRSVRGGSWSDKPWNCRSASRNAIGADTWNYYVGFRLVASNVRT